MDIEYLEKYNYNEYIHKEIIKTIKSITPKYNVKMVICGCKSFTNFLDKNTLNEYLVTNNYLLINKIDKSQTTIEICKNKETDLTNFYKSLQNYLIEFVTSNYILENYFNLFNSSIYKNDVLSVEKNQNMCIYSINVNNNQNNVKYKMPILRLIENTTDKNIKELSDTIYYQPLIKFLERLDKNQKLSDNEIIQFYILLKFMMDGKMTYEYYDALYKLQYNDLANYSNSLTSIITSIVNKLNNKINIKELKKITKLDYKVDTKLLIRKINKDYFKNLVINKTNKYLFIEDMNTIPSEFIINEHLKLSKTIDTSCLSNNMNNEILNNLLQLTNLNITSNTIKCVNNLNNNILSIHESNNQACIADKDFIIYVDNINMLKINKKTKKYNNINILDGSLFPNEYFSKDTIIRIHVPKENKYLLTSNKAYLPIGSEFVLEKINYLYDLSEGIRKVKVITYKYTNTLSNIRNIESLINYLCINDNIIPDFNINNDNNSTDINYTLTTSSEETLTGGDYSISSINFDSVLNEKGMINKFADDGDDVDFNNSSENIKFNQGVVNQGESNKLNKMEGNIDTNVNNKFANTEIISTPKTYDEYLRRLIKF